ncbi:hypothetical protein PV797_08210 [Clostridiaceae bacterium M8S5]|nr:hypothetical protein PV797_08210 [Clostridiaceae bacterium M8S5]
MKNRVIYILILTLTCTLIITSCDKNNSEKEEIRKQQAVIDDLNDKLSSAEEKETLLKNQIDQLRAKASPAQQKAELYEIEHEYFPFVTNSTLLFVRAQTIGDISAIEDMIGGKLSVIKEGNTLKIQKEKDDSLEIYNEDSLLVYKDMVIQGYEYYPKNDIFRVYIREFYQNKEDEKELSIKHLNLSFTKIDNIMKIVDIEFDS